RCGDNDSRRRTAGDLKSDDSQHCSEKYQQDGNSLEDGVHTGNSTYLYLNDRTCVQGFGQQAVRVGSEYMGHSAHHFQQRPAFDRAADCDSRAMGSGIKWAGRLIGQTLKMAHGVQENVGLRLCSYLYAGGVRGV